MTDSFTEDLVPELMDLLKAPEGTVRALCQSVTGAALRDRGVMWGLAQTYGVAFEAVQALASYRLPDLQAIGQGAAASGISAMALSQKQLLQELSAGEHADLDRARALSSISKQQSDLARAWLPAEAQTHQHLHAVGSIEAIAALMERKEQKPLAEVAREALRAKGKEV